MENITKKQLIKKLNEVINTKHTKIDLKVDDKNLIDLEPVSVDFDLILECDNEMMYLSSITEIRIYKQKENDIKYELIYMAEVTQDVEKMTKKELVHELRFLREVVKNQALEITKLIYNKTYTPVEKNPRGAGRRPYSDFEIVKKIFDYYINGYSTNKIADILNSSLDNAKSWSKSNIRVILLNPYYIDKCIDRSTFDKVYDMMKNKPKGRGKKEIN